MKVRERSADALEYTQDKDLAGEQFDCVALFNVIDRCDKPVTPLRQVRHRLRSSDSWYPLPS